MGNHALNIVLIAWVLACALEGACARPDCGRHLNFKVGVYDPQGTSESSKYRPSRKPEDQDRETIDVSRPSPPPPLPVPSPPPPHKPPSPKPSNPSPETPLPVPSPQVEGDPGTVPEIPNGTELLPRGTMCSSSRIKEDKLLAGNFIGTNFYNMCKNLVNNAEDCCAMCQNNRDCTGFVYERADCSGFGGPTNTGVCLQIKDSVVSWPAIGSEMGSLNPFAQ